MKEHRTQAASEKANDLWCYQCFTMDDGEKCINLTGNTGNSSTFRHKCTDDKRICMVRLRNFLLIFMQYFSAKRGSCDPLV